MLIRILLFGMIGYFLYRVLVLAMRMRSSDRKERREEGDPFASASPEQYKNIEDAEFEDITPKETKEKNEPPTSS